MRSLLTGEKLVRMAREAIKQYLETGKMPEPDSSDPELREMRGIFVTLHKHGDLRGCIGMIEPTMPLCSAIEHYACHAAFRDMRFPPVSKGELEDIDIEVSLLSPLQRVKDPSQIKMGTHGVVVKRGKCAGVFLPQVAAETGWSREEFLSNLCCHKAGLAPDAWEDPGTELYCFTVQVFKEEE